MDVNELGVNAQVWASTPGVKDPLPPVQGETKVTQLLRLCGVSRPKGKKAHHRFVHRRVWEEERGGTFGGSPIRGVNVVGRLPLLVERARASLLGKSSPLKKKNAAQENN